MKRTAMIVGASALAAMAASQEGSPISTDRPSFSDGTLIVPRGRWQLETGYTFTKIDHARFESIGEVLLRFPVSGQTELRISNLSIGRSSGSSAHQSGLLDPTVGVKIKVASGAARKSPDLALILQTTVPAGNRAFRVDRAQPTAKIAFYQPLDASSGLGGNLLASDLGSGNSTFTQFGVSLYLAKTLTSETALFAEVYRLMPIADGGPHSNFADTGATYLLSPNAQVDFRVGTGFDMKRDGWFFGFGVAYRF